jgi:hypothetical protein
MGLEQGRVIAEMFFKVTIFILTAPIDGYDLHFMDKETEAQRGPVTCRETAQIILAPHLLPGPCDTHLSSLNNSIS